MLDVGGGTGLYATLLPQSAEYLCLDYDFRKLGRLKAKQSRARVVQSDVASMSLQSKSIDAAMCIAVSHHLDDATLVNLFRELARVIRTRVIFLDAVRSPRRVLSQLLWRLDGGSFPRSEETLLDGLSIYFDLEHTESYAIYHRYILCIATPRVSGRADR